MKSILGNFCSSFLDSVVYMYNCCTTFYKNCAEINSRKFMFCKFRLEILPSNSCVWNSKLFFHIFMDWNLTENWKPYSDWKTSCSLMASLPRGQQVGIKNWRLHLDIGNHFFVLFAPLSKKVPLLRWFAWTMRVVCSRIHKMNRIFFLDLIHVKDSNNRLRFLQRKSWKIRDEQYTLDFWR